MTDPGCLVDQVKDKADETVDDAERTFEDTTDEGVETIDETVKGVDETVDEVRETVDDTVDPPDQPEPPAPPSAPEKGNDPRREGEPKKDDKVKSDELGDEREADEEGTSAAAGPGPLDPPTNLPEDSIETAAAGKPTVEDEAGNSIIETAKKFTFPLAMTLAAAIFMVIQHRIDRRDPKFTLAPVEHEYLSFE